MAARIHEVVSGLVILGALGFLFGVVWVAIAHFSAGTTATANTPATPPSASNAVAIIGSVTGVVGTIIAAFFGIRAVQDQATQGQQTVQQQATQTQQTLQQTQQTIQQAQNGAQQAQQQARTATAGMLKLAGTLSPDQWAQVQQDPSIQRLIQPD